MVVVAVFMVRNEDFSSSIEAGKIKNHSHFNLTKRDIDHLGDSQAKDMESFGIDGMYPTKG